MVFDVDEPDPTPIAPLDPVVWPAAWLDDDAPARAMPAATPDHPDRRDDPAWDTYHRAFAALEDGDRARAYELVHGLVTAQPTHPAAVQARRIAALLGTEDADGQVHLTEPVAPVERKTGNARAELAVVQTGHGVAVGVELCALAGCQDNAALALALLGGTAGAVGTLALTDDLLPGVATAIDSGTVWGFVNGALAAGATGTDLSGPALALQGVGTLAGALVATRHPRAGAIAAMNSGGLWGLVLGLTAVGAFASQPDDRTFAVTSLVTLNLGLATGAAIGMLDPRLDRGDTLIYDVGGLAGLLVGTALVRGLGGASGDDAPEYAGAGIGALAGLGITAAILRVVDRGHRHPAVAQTYVVPAPDHAHGGVAGLSLRF